ncbi:MAG: anti-sigma factor antagonist [Frankia sp.]
MTEYVLSLAEAVLRRSVRSAPRFHTDIYAPPDRTVVRVHGEIDVATGEAFRAALRAGLDRRPPLLVVDLIGVSFLGAGALGLLVGAANRGADDGIPITVIGARPHIYRLFALTGLVDRLDVHPTPSAGTLVPVPSRPVTAAAEAAILTPAGIGNRPRPMSTAAAIPPVRKATGNITRAGADLRKPAPETPRKPLRALYVRALSTPRGSDTSRDAAHTL